MAKRPKRLFSAADTSKAAALKYSPDASNAPVVVASGRNLLARRIVEIAQEHGIPILKDNSLVDLLLSVPVETEIPSELYQAVAEVLAYVYQMHGRFGKMVQTE